MKKNQLVVKSNDLVNAAYRLSLVEQRLLLACIAQIDSRDALTEEDVFEISASEIMDLLGESAQRGTIYRDLKTATERLWGRTISFSDNVNHYGKRRWITEVDYFLNEGRVRIRFSRDVIQYLSGLKSAFTQYKLEYVAHFKSSYSVRIYELLVQWMSTGER
jgi:plasmid replication initiation protein